MKQKTKSAYTHHARRLAVLVLCVLLVAVSLLSLIGAYSHLSRVHDHRSFSEQCATCRQIQAIEKLIKQLSLSLLVAIALCVALPVGVFFGVAAALRHNHATLFSLRVRLNN